MEKENNKEKIQNWLDNLPVKSENPAFSGEEMIVCEKCQRKNPPNRLKCLYCGKELEISETQAGLVKPNLRKMEAWENGFNLIYRLKDSNFDSRCLPEVSKILGIDAEILEKLFETESSLPLARAGSKREAEIVQINLSKFGIETQILSDEILDVKNPPKRIRSIEFFPEKLKLVSFNQEKEFEIPIEDLTLIVTGKIFERKVEAVEKRNRKGENKILQAMETAFDENLFDIYSKNDASGFRILEKGFDFSCLGEEKEILASKNLPKLIEKLKTFVGDAKFVDDYLKVREVLGNVWEIENKTNSQGFRRKGFGNVNLENVATANNLAQFTKYSRLQNHII